MYCPEWDTWEWKERCQNNTLVSSLTKSAMITLVTCLVSQPLNLSFFIWKMNIIPSLEPLLWMKDDGWVDGLTKSTQRHRVESLTLVILKHQERRAGKVWIKVGWPSYPKSWCWEKTLILGKAEGRRRRGWQMRRWLYGLTNSIDMSLSKLQEMVKNREACSSSVHGVAKSWTQLSNWTTTAKVGWRL